MRSARMYINTTHSSARFPLKLPSLLRAMKKAFMSTKQQTSRVAKISHSEIALASQPDGFGTVLDRLGRFTTDPRVLVGMRKRNFREHRRSDSFYSSAQKIQ